MITDWLATLYPWIKSFHIMAVMSWMAGLFYLAVGLAAGAVAGLLGAFPKAMVLAVAGFALLGTIGGGLAAAMGDLTWREPALVTFLVTLSGLSMAGIGSAFWGVVAGTLCVAVMRLRAG